MDDAEGSGTYLEVGERSIIDAISDAVIVTDPAGHIMFWNESAERLYGWTEPEVLGRSVLDVLAPMAERAENHHDLTSVAAGKVLSGDRTVVRRDGELIRVQTYTRPVLSSHGEIVAIVGTSEDVTKLRLAEQDSRDLTEHFRLALEAGGLGTWRWHMASGEVRWDERLEAMFGFERGGFDGTFETYASRIHPEDQDHVIKMVGDAVSQGSNYRVEHRVVWPDGSVRWVAGAGGVTFDTHGNVTGTVGCALDVTDRVLQELEHQQLAELALEAADREKLQRDRLEFLAAMNDAVNKSRSVREIMVNVTRTAVPRLGDWCSIHVLPHKGSNVPEVEVTHNDPHMVNYARELQERFPYDPDATTGVAHVIRSGESAFYPILSEDVIAALNVTDEERTIVSDLGLRSAIIVPLIKGKRVLGAIQFVISDSSRLYTEDDVALAQTVAGRVASSLENRRLNEQQQLIAQTLQRSLLPSSLPDIPGIDIAVRYWPAGEGTEVGGDFFDVFALETNGHWALVVGDVCGTGPAAAALTGLARHSIRESAWHGDSPVEVLNSLNRAVQRSGTGSFLTAIYATLDTTCPRPELTLACGGHPLPILASTQTTEPIGAPGTLLGIFDNVQFHPATMTLNPGDVVVFYTDGATDVHPPHALDQAQFARLVEHSVSAPTAQAIADQVQEALDAILPFTSRNDDIALLVLRVIDDDCQHSDRFGTLLSG